MTARLGARAAIIAALRVYGATAGANGAQAASASPLMCFNKQGSRAKKNSREFFKQTQLPTFLRFCVCRSAPPCALPLRARL
jgi:hypothetical protein